MTRSTSIKAYREIRDSGLLSERRWQVYRALYKHGPATASEIYFKAKMKKQLQASIPSRLAELRHMECVDEVGKRPCKHTGKTCIVWDVNGKLPTPLVRPSNKKDREIKFLRARVKRLSKKLAMLEK